MKTTQAISGRCPPPAPPTRKSEPPPSHISPLGTSAFDPTPALMCFRAAGIRVGYTLFRPFDSVSKPLISDDSTGRKNIVLTVTKSLYKELKGGGLQLEDILAVATRLLDMITVEMEYQKKSEVSPSDLLRLKLRLHLAVSGPPKICVPPNYSAASNNPEALRVLTASIYLELSKCGFNKGDMMVVGTNLIPLIHAGIKDERRTPDK